MSRSHAEDLLPLDIEGGSAINWRAVIAAGVVALIVLLGLGTTLALNSRGKSVPVNEPAKVAKRSQPTASTAPWWTTLPPAPALAPEIQAELLPPPVEEATPVARTVIVQPERVPPPSLVIASETQPGADKEGLPLWVRTRALNRMDEERLTEHLMYHSTEIDLDLQKGTARELAVKGMSTVGKGRVPAAHPLLELAATRADLAGLPLRGEKECLAEENIAKHMATFSRHLRTSLLAPGRNSASSSYEKQRRADFTRDKSWNQKESVATMLQVIQGQEKPDRTLMLGLMSEIKGPEAGAALAHRAVFDFDPEVREAAVRALQQRSRKEYRHVLLEALRYPWAPIADHAAATLVALEDRDAIPSLVDLLDLPDPTAPVLGKDNRLQAPELVRVNHLRNCVLCHGMAGSSESPLGAIPTPGRPIPTEVYYSRGSSGMVRADVTYLKQDFSILQYVDYAHPWPERQRFDYLIRMKQLTPAEEKEYQEGKATRKGEVYSQKVAVLHALWKLTGKYLGDTAKDWQDVRKECEFRD